jgi:hypothetical protein
MFSPRRRFPFRALSTSTTLALLLVAGSACSSPDVAGSDTVGVAAFDAPAAANLVSGAEAQGMVKVAFPSQNPGIPAYARLGAPLNQLFHDDRWLVIPFYRNPAMIDGAFNLLSIFDFPGPNGPGAFAVPLTISGFFMTERDASPTTFPHLVISSGTEVPIWFVSWPVFNAARGDGVVTMDELRAMQPVQGTATRFEETLRPREGEHLVVLNAQGRTTDGRSFQVHVTHVEDVTKALRISLR